jgi:D-glycero-D-manno-heptose 1,7-bisphosphate phosphatase
MASRAIFLDRDNTLVEDPGFIERPEQVKLLPDVPAALRRFHACGYRIIVVSNQSGIARGLFDETQLGRIHDRLRELLAAQGVQVDGIYYCPYLDGPEAVVEAYRCDSDLRKPQPGMLRQAAREHDLDLARSWMIGDRGTDVAAGAAAGCRTILVSRARAPYNGVQPDHVVETLMEAARVVEQEHNRTSEHRPELGDETSRRLLTEIRDALDRQGRRATQDDFSLIRLVGSLMQMLAIVAAIWGVIGIFSSGNGPVAAISRFGLAIFLQLVAITIHLMDRRR